MVSIILGIVFILLFSLGCYNIWWAINDYNNGKYSYERSFEKEKLETFIIDLDTSQQYEEWFCPDNRFVPFDDRIKVDMSKTVVFEKKPYRSVDIALTCYIDTQAAIESYNHYFESAKKTNEMFPSLPRDEYITKRINPNYEYSYKASTIFNENFWSWYFFSEYVPVPEVRIRYKNVIFRFTDYSVQRNSRINATIDLLWADYERYKEEME